MASKFSSPILDKLDWGQNLAVARRLQETYVLGVGLHDVQQVEVHVLGVQFLMELPGD